jgi:hypothetical protein
MQKFKAYAFFECSLFCILCEEAEGASYMDIDCISSVMFLRC